MLEDNSPPNDDYTKVVRVKPVGSIHTAKRKAYRFSMDMFLSQGKWSADITHSVRRPTHHMPHVLQAYAKGLEEVAKGLRDQAAVMEGIKVWR